MRAGQLDPALSQFRDSAARKGSPAADWVRALGRKTVVLSKFARVHVHACVPPSGGTNRHSVGDRERQRKALAVVGVLTD